MCCPFTVDACSVSCGDDYLTCYGADKVAAPSSMKETG
jgi:hypothetical protein